MKHNMAKKEEVPDDWFEEKDQKTMQEKLRAHRGKHLRRLQEIEKKRGKRKRNGAKVQSDPTPVN